jgi:hypothetical protein
MTDKKMPSSVNQTGTNNVIGAAAMAPGASATNSGNIRVGGPPVDEQSAANPAEPRPSDSTPSSGGLPPYRAILAVDAERSTDVTSAQMAQLCEDIVRVLEAAFVRAGLAEDWAAGRFRVQAHRGDGYVVGLLPKNLPRLLHPFLRELQDELRARDRGRRANQARLRLRASIHVGPLPDAGTWTDGVGKPMADTHRLLDSDEVRELLRTAHQEITFLAVILSPRAFEDVVQAGFTELHPDQFTRVVVSVKRGTREAYLYLPQR